MKKLVLPLITIALLGSACTKDAATTQPEGLAEGAIEGVAKGQKLYSMTFKENDLSAHCGIPPKNCIHGVIIYGSRNRIQNLLTTVLTEDDRLIQAEFKGMRTVLADYMDADLVDAVIAGTSVARSTTKTDDKGHKWMIIKENSATQPIEAVYGW